MTRGFLDLQHDWWMHLRHPMGLTSGEWSRRVEKATAHADDRVNNSHAWCSKPFLEMTLLLTNPAITITFGDLFSTKLTVRGIRFVSRWFVGENSREARYVEDQHDNQNLLFLL